MVFYHAQLTFSDARLNAPMTNNNDKTAISLRYQDAGVDIGAGNTLVNRIKPLAAKTERQEVMSDLGGFGGMFALPPNKYKQPVLIASTDGVGTKLKLAIESGIHNTIGIDLVAMCVNDIIVSGAEPLFFLDYYAAGKLDIDVAESVIAGIATGCELAGVALIGGETAEMPGMYQKNDYDLAGFCVGIVEKHKQINGRRVEAGDILIGLASSGVHANGYSLIRAIIERNDTALSAPFADSTLIAHLLTPTRIYISSLMQLIEKINIHALAHITGGGLLDNIPRVLPDNIAAVVDAGSWHRPLIFDWLATEGNVTDDEMYRTFNNGIGMVVCVAKKDAPYALSLLADLGETAWQIGHIATSEQSTPKVVINH